MAGETIEERRFKLERAQTLDIFQPSLMYLYIVRNN